MTYITCHPELVSGSQKTAPSPAFQAPSPVGRGRKAAFTLAEVLITLGIIGVVAAMTLPTLIQHHRKQVIESRLAKFYSTISQAVKMAEVEYGPAAGWDPLLLKTVYDESGNVLYYDVIGALDWYNKYLAKHLKTTKVEQSEDFEKNITIYFADGSLLHGGVNWYFYPDAKDFLIRENDNKLKDRDRSLSGKKYFVFYRNNNCKNGQFVPYGTCVEKVLNAENVTNYIKTDPSIGCRESVTNERALCTLLIARNGWKIPKDYPVKF